MPLVLLAFLGACSNQPQTDAELTAQAQRAVDRKLSAQATFSEMEATVARQIACGHASVAGSASRAPLNQDFVYRDKRLIMDDDPDFDGAAIQCDLAASGVTLPEDNSS
jgi:hypothetical protein